MAKPDEPKGIYPKYIILRNDGFSSGSRPVLRDLLDDNVGALVDGDAMVLRPERDPHARAAMAAYAESCSRENRELADGLMAIVHRHSIAANERVIACAEAHLAAIHHNANHAETAKALEEALVGVGKGRR